MAITLESVLDRVFSRETTTEVLKVAHQANLLYDPHSIDRIAQDYVAHGQIQKAGSVLLRGVSLEKAIEFYEEHGKSDLALQILNKQYEKSPAGIDDHGSYTKHFTVMDHVISASFYSLPVILAVSVCGAVVGSIGAGLFGFISGIDHHDILSRTGESCKNGSLYGAFLPSILIGAYGIIEYAFSNFKKPYFNVNKNREIEDKERTALIFQHKGYIDDAVNEVAILGQKPYSPNMREQIYAKSGWVFHGVASALRRGDKFAAKKVYAQRTLEDITIEAQFSVELIDALVHLMKNNFGLTSQSFYDESFYVPIEESHQKLQEFQRRIKGFNDTCKDTGLNLGAVEAFFPHESFYFNFLQLMHNIKKSSFEDLAKHPKHLQRFQQEIDYLEKRILIDERVRWLQNLDPSKKAAAYKRMLESVDEWDAIRIMHYMGDTLRRNVAYEQVQQKVSDYPYPASTQFIRNKLPGVAYLQKKPHVKSHEVKSIEHAQNLGRLAEELGDTRTAIKAYTQANMFVDAANLILKKYEPGISSFDDIKSVVSLFERAGRYADAGYVARQYGEMDEALRLFRKIGWAVDDTLTIERALELRDTENLIQYSKKMSNPSLIKGAIGIAQQAGGLERAILLAEELQEYKSAGSLCFETDPLRAIEFFEKGKLWEDAAGLVVTAKLDESDPLRALAIYESAKMYSQAYALAVKEGYTDKILGLANTKILRYVERGEEWMAFYEIRHTQGLDSEATLEAAYKKIVGRRGTSAAAKLAYSEGDLGRAIRVANGNYGGGVDLSIFDELLSLASRDNNGQRWDYFSRERQSTVQWLDEQERIAEEERRYNQDLS